MYIPYGGTGGMSESFGACGIGASTQPQICRPIDSHYEWWSIAVNKEVSQNRGQRSPMAPRGPEI